LDVIEEWVWFYYNKGFSLIPAKSTNPPSVDNKKPNVPEWETYQSRRPTVEEIRGWLDKGLFGNIALIMGHVSGDMVAIDIDDSKIVFDLSIDLDKFMDEKGIWVQATGKENGYHLICKNIGDPGDLEKNKTVNLEYRANGGYIIACPSIHPNGKSYHYLNYDAMESLPDFKPWKVKDVYDDMVTRLYEKRGIKKVKADSPMNMDNIDADCIKNVFKGGLIEGKRNDTAYALANWYKNVKRNNPTEIRVMMANWNNRNNPPLEARELNPIITSALKTDKKIGCTRWNSLGFCPHDDKKECKFINKPKNKEETEETTKVTIEDTLYEQVYDPVTFETRFVYLNEGTVHYKDQVEYNSIKFIPINDRRAIEMGAIFFPDVPVDYGTLQELIIEINEFIHKYMDVSDLFQMFSAWYVVFSWVTDNINTVPYLRVVADFGTGKSRFLQTVGKICYKPMILAGATTVASMFRSIERWRGTLILEEYTPKESGEEEDETKILNCGFERGIPVTRCNKDKNCLEYFDCFGPKVISSRHEFKDAALNSRCLTEILKETNRKDIPILLPPEFYKRQQELRNKLLMFRLQHWQDVDPNKIQEVKFPDISKRLKQAFSSFVALFAHDEIAMEMFMDYVKLYNRKMIDEQSQSFDGCIVNAFFDLKNDGLPYVTSHMISEQMATKGVKDKEGNAISTRSIGRHLKTLGLETKPKCVDGKTSRVVVEEVNVLDTLKRKYVFEEVVDDSQKKIEGCL
jgi:hypothetical protein